MTTGQPPEPAPAATVVLLRPAARGGEPEVLLTRRPTTMAFAGGMHVFPGGRVDAADRDPGAGARSARSPDEAARALGDNLPPADALALHVAVIRELAEEAGVSLEDADGRLRTDRLAPIAHWVTPRFMPRRFSTWFFVADLPPGAEPVFAADEVADHRWVTSTAALEQLAAGEIGMWGPTTSVLERLVEIGARTAADVASAIVMRPAPPPRVVEEGDAVVRIALGGVGALPGRLGEAVLHGRRELVLVDPGDPSDMAVDAILAAAERRAGTIRAIVLTATGPDHAAAAEALAIPLEVPILVAPGAGRRLPYATREVADGELLPADVDVRVRLGPPGPGRLELVAASAGE
ncbi:MAG TPA: MBL fold metallo-hydrolase [Candidatus Limnocylindrales bacterium]|nr:MBL fold metallo-hydrolase [Candidatus Limnocylindrales bacterium]